MPCFCIWLLAEVTMGNKGWEFTGISCVHATCAILMEHKELEYFVSHCYSVDMYKKAYNYTINSVLDHSQWLTNAIIEQTAPSEEERSG